MSDVGVIVFDLQGGDAAYHFVDRERWDQILEVHANANENERDWTNKVVDVVGWLTSDESPETHQPVGAPDRRGKLLGTCYTQTFVIERVGIEGNIIGLLTLP